MVIRRSVAELISIVSYSEEIESIIKLFHEHMREIFSHPKVDITNNLIHINKENLSRLRINLLSCILQSPSLSNTEDVKNLKLDVSSSNLELTAVLRRRYKDTTLIEDIYVFGMTLVEGTIHPEFSKAFSVNNSRKSHDSPQPDDQHKQQASLNQNIENETADQVDDDTSRTEVSPQSNEDEVNAVPKTNSIEYCVAGMKTMQSQMKKLIDEQRKIISTPLNADTKLLAEKLAEISETLKGSRKENKELKEQIGLLVTKFDKQNADFKKLKMEHDSLIKLQTPQQQAVIRNTGSVTKRPVPPVSTTAATGGSQPMDLVQLGLQRQNILNINSASILPNGHAQSDMQQKNSTANIGVSNKNNAMKPNSHSNTDQITDLQFNIPTSNRFVFPANNDFSNGDNLSNNSSNPERYRGYIPPQPKPNWNLASKSTNDSIAYYENIRKGRDEFEQQNNQDGFNSRGTNVSKPRRKWKSQTGPHLTPDKSNKSVIFGTKVSNEVSLAGDRNHMDIFVGGLNKSVSVDRLANYLNDKLHVEPVNIILNKTNEFNQSYKITIRGEDKNKVLCAEAWENNIIVKPFRRRRPIPTTNSQDDNFSPSPTSTDIPPRNNPAQQYGQRFENFYV